MKQIIKVISLICLLILGSYHFIASQTVTVGSVESTAGSSILVPVNFENLDNIGAILLFITYDDAILTYDGVTNIVPQGAGTIAFPSSNPTKIGLSWIAGSSGVNFPDGKYLDIQFTFNGGYSDLTFLTQACEIAEFDGTILDVTYIDGSVYSPGISLDLNLFLEGAYIPGSGGLMQTNLLDGGLLPLGQPFDPVLPYNGNNEPCWLYSGSETVASFPATTVDWILLELRDAATAALATPATKIAQKPCLLLEDGSVVDINGSQPFLGVTFTEGAFVVVWHRNHLGIMNATPLTETGGTYQYDFSSAVTQVAGEGTGYIELETGIWGLAAGDLNADKVIDDNDFSDAWMEEAGFSGYRGSDANMDAQMNNRDKNNLLYWNRGKVSGVPD